MPTEVIILNVRVNSLNVTDDGGRINCLFKPIVISRMKLNVWCWLIYVTSCILHVFYVEMLASQGKHLAIGKQCSNIRIDLGTSLHSQQSGITPVRTT